MLFIRRFWAQLVDRLAPPLTIRRQFLVLARRAPQTFAQAGFTALWQRTRAALRRYQRTGALLIPATPPAKAYSYTEWRATHTPDTALLQAQREQSLRLACQPQFSLLWPVFAQSLAEVQATVATVQAQSYPFWELWVVGSGVPADVQRYLQTLAVHEPRLRLHPLAQPTAAAAPAALTLAQGDFCLWLDAADQLAPHLLYEVANTLSQQPTADIVYFDEDHSTAQDQQRLEPWFKPTWSPELMWSVNLLEHAVYRRTLIDAVGGLDPAMGEAQSWDLALRASRAAHRIVHLPKVLYHQRSTAAPEVAAAQAQAARQRAIERCLRAHLARLGLAETALSLTAQGQPRLFFPTDQFPDHAKVSIIMLALGDLAQLRNNLAILLAKTLYPHYEIILVLPAASQPEALALFATDERVRFLTLPPEQRTFNHWRARNWGAQHATGDWLLFLHSAVSVQDAHWLTELVGWARQPEIGVVGAHLVDAAGIIQRSGLVVGLTQLAGSLFAGTVTGADSWFGNTAWVRNCSAVSSACLLVGRTRFGQLQGFDEAYTAAYGDLEFCLRVQAAGYRIVSTPFPRLLYPAQADEPAMPLQDMVRAACQLLGLLRQGDLYFHPALSYNRGWPTLAEPSEEPGELRVIRRLQAVDLIADDVSPTFHERLYHCPPRVSSWPQTPQGAASLRRLLLVSHDLSLSGAPLMLYALAEYLLGAGFQIAVFAAEEGPLRALYEQQQVAVTVEPSLIHCPSNALAIAQVAHEFDLIIANTIVSWRALPVAKAFGLPVMGWIHEAQPGVEFCQKIPSLVRSLPLADCLIFPTQATEQLYAAYLAEIPHTVIPYGLAPQSLEQSVVLEWPASARLRVMCIGSLEPRKGQDFLLQSLAALPVAAQAQIELFLIGRPLWPDYVSSVAQLAQALPHVTFVGETQRAQTMAYLRAADILILPSRDEVLPVILLEAMYHAKAIVATRVGGVAEAITDGTHGLLVEFGDQVGLGAAVQRLIADAVFRQALGRNAQTRFHEKFTIDKMGQRFLHIIDELLAGANATT